MRKTKKEEKKGEISSDTIMPPKALAYCAFFLATLGCENSGSDDLSAGSVGAPQGDGTPESKAEEINGYIGQWREVSGAGVRSSIYFSDGLKTVSLPRILVVSERGGGFIETNLPINGSFFVRPRYAVNSPYLIGLEENLLVVKGLVDHLKLDYQIIATYRRVTKNNE